MENHKIADRRIDSRKIPVAVIGARGYSGLELCRLLFKHPDVELTAYSAAKPFALADFLPQAQGRQATFFHSDDLSAIGDQARFVFLATPAETSAELAPKLMSQGHHVIDLSGAFRLQAGSTQIRQQNYQSWYGFSHPEPTYLDKAEYGLSPWAQPSIGKGPRLIANPGCYATSILMALLPLLKTRIIAPESLVIDAKSGSSGAGRKAAENLLFSEVEGECTPYKVAQHQHLPEIMQWTEKFAGVKIQPMFSTHLLPVRRGITSAIYARLDQNLTDKTTSTIKDMIMHAYHEAYASYPLLEYAEVGSAQSSRLLSLRSVVGTARTQISFLVKGDQLYVFSVIDNLLKGAASQAIENMNRLLDFPCSMGLMESEAIP